MTLAEWYCSGAKQLDNFLDTLRSNYQSHAHIFRHGDPDKVKYSASLLTTWNNDPDPAQRQTLIADPVKWLRDLRRDSDPCLEGFDPFSEEMQMLYGNKDRKLNAAIQSMPDLLRSANELVRIDDNQVKANRTTAGWFAKENKNLYEIAWSGVRTGLISKIKLFTPKKRRFHSMEELFDRAANAQVKPDSNKLQPEQLQQQQRQSGESSSQ
jgi:hypothetical protein